MLNWKWLLKIEGAVLIVLIVLSKTLLNSGRLEKPHHLSVLQQHVEWEIQWDSFCMLEQLHLHIKLLINLGRLLIHTQCYYQVHFPCENSQKLFYFSGVFCNIVNLSQCLSIMWQTHHGLGVLLFEDRWNVLKWKNAVETSDSILYASTKCDMCYFVIALRVYMRPCKHPHRP